MALSELLLNKTALERTMTKIALSDIDLGDNVGRRVRRPVDGSPLLASMSRSGLINPITISRSGDNRYQLVSGYGRLECARVLGWTAIDATIVSGTPVELSLLAVGENVGRQDYSIWDQCHAYQHLYLQHGLTPADIASRFGRHLKYVQLCLSLPRKLSPKVQAQLDKGSTIPVTLLMRWRVMPPERQDKRLAMWLAGDTTVEKAEKRRRIETRALERYRDLLALAPPSPEREAVIQSLEYLLGDASLPTFLRVKG